MKRLRSVLTPFVGVLVFLAVWEVGVALYRMPAYLLPAPSVIFETFVREFPRLAYHGWVTAYEMLLGYALARSEEHTSELQSQSNLVCRLLLEKKKKKHHKMYISQMCCQHTI